MLTNLKKATDLKAEQNGGTVTVRDTFTDLFLRTAAHQPPALSGDGGVDLAAAFAEHRAATAHDMRAVPEFIFAKQKIDAPQKKVVRAEMRGGKQTVAYMYDAAVAESEELYSLHKVRGTTIKQYCEANWPITLSEQPIGRERKAFQEPSYLLYDLDYTLVADGENATLKVVETLVPRVYAQRAFRFNLHDVYYDGNRKARRFNVRSIKDEQGKDVSFVHREGELLVSIPNKVAENEMLKLTFEIDGDFLDRPSGDSYWELGTSPWFPQPDLNGQFYTVHSVVKVKKPFVPFAPGTTVRRVEEGDYHVVENKIDKPVQFAVALAGKYAYEEETQKGVTIRVATYAGKNTRAMKQLTNLAFKIIEFYGPFLGPFPFPELNIIEINEFGYGQAPPGTMFITKEAFNPLGAEINQIFSKGINHRFAHEIAHQYWGHVIKMGSRDEQWVTESFAEYSSSLVVKQIKGNDDYKAMISTWRANAKDAKESSSIATANRLANYGDSGTAFMNRTHLIYDKGAYLLSQLHKEIGDDAFFSFLRNYQHIYQWKFATTTDMVTLLQKLTQKDYTKFFEQNFWGTGLP
ncbi:MAG TPA: M1 family aminopeptidase [Thermoanaerobaculia bacterium]|nr:M1 family aminopeptidase [Thermoanaerobaculia bacterium]